MTDLNQSAAGLAGDDDITGLGCDLADAPTVTDRHATPPTIRHFNQTQAQRKATTIGYLAAIRALATDPHLYTLALIIPDRTIDDMRRVGGRTPQYPAWVMLLIEGLVAKYGSISAATRELNDEDAWRIVCFHATNTLNDLINNPDSHPDACSSAHVNPADAVTAYQGMHAQLPALAAVGHGPTRGQYHYFAKHRLTPEIEEALATRRTELAVQRMHEIGLANPEDNRSLNHLRRSRCLMLDGKVVNSPLRTLDTERVDKATGEIKPVRVDDARGLYGEGGHADMAWGSKWAIPVIADTMTNLRVIPAIEHIPHGKNSSEAKSFKDILDKILPLMPGIDAVIIDGAVQGDAINAIQTQHGRAVISPPRRTTKGKGGIGVNGVYYAAKQLPYDTKQPATGWTCGGPVLWASAGTLWTSEILDDGTEHYEQVTRGQVKIDSYTDKTGTTKYKMTVQFALDQCPECGENHIWWESLTSKMTDTKAKFNRAQYLRVLGPYDTVEWSRVYPMRGDAESTNAKVERAWYGSRIPAWGKNNQARIIRAWATYMNATARLTYQHYLQTQRPAVLPGAA